MIYTDNEGIMRLHPKREWIYYVYLWSTILVVLFIKSTSCPGSEEKKKVYSLRTCLSPFQCCCAFNIMHYPTVETGDFVKIWWDSKLMRTVKVFHWTYAITDDTIFHFLPFNDTHGIGLIGSLNLYHGAYSIGPNPRKVARLPRQMSYCLAYRLAGVELPFHDMYCNCRHYVDYLVYGMTFGKKWNRDLSGWPIRKTCPLHRQLTAEMDVCDDDFFLEDGEKTQYKVNRIPD